MLPDDYRHQLARQQSSKPGRMWARASLIGAVLALAVAPVVFGPLGIVASMVAFWKGARWWGAAGVSGSAVAAVVGYYMADSVIG